MILYELSQYNFTKVLRYLSNTNHHRQRLTGKQYDVLESFYSEVTKYPRFDQYEQLEQNTGLTNKQLRVGLVVVMQLNTNCL